MPAAEQQPTLHPSPRQPGRFFASPSLGYPAGVDPPFARLSGNVRAQDFL